MDVKLCFMELDEVPHRYQATMGDTGGRTVLVFCLLGLYIFIKSVEVWWSMYRIFFPRKLQSKESNERVRALRRGSKGKNTITKVSMSHVTSAPAGKK